MHTREPHGNENLKKFSRSEKIASEQGLDSRVAVKSNGLRSRVRRFESCRGHLFDELDFTRRAENAVV